MRSRSDDVLDCDPEEAAQPSLRDDAFDESDPRVARLLLEYNAGIRDELCRVRERFTPRLHFVPADPDGPIRRVEFSHNANLYQLIRLHMQPRDTVVGIHATRVARTPEPPGVALCLFVEGIDRPTRCWLLPVERILDGEFVRGHAGFSFLSESVQ